MQTGFGMEGKHGKTNAINVGNCVCVCACVRPEAESLYAASFTAHSCAENQSALSAVNVSGHWFGVLAFSLHHIVFVLML